MRTEAATHPLDVVDLMFSLHGEAIPTNHAYQLYSAVSRSVPVLHKAKRLGLFPIRGLADDAGRLTLTRRSVLRLRLPQEMVGEAIRLSGKRLNIDGATIQVGVPRVIGLEPAPTLYSPLVYIKLADAEERGVTAEKFADSVSKQLEALEVNGETSIPISSNGSNVAEPRRRILQVKGYTLVGYAVRVTGLNADESLRLQVEGVGGKRRMGCGLFLPIRNRGSKSET